MTTAVLAILMERPAADQWRRWSSPDDSLQTAFSLAKKAVLEKRFNPAQEFLTYIITEDPTYQDPTGQSAWYLQAVIQEQMNNRSGAIQILDRGYQNLAAGGRIDPYLQLRLADLLSQESPDPDVGKITALTYGSLGVLDREIHRDLFDLITDVFGFLVAHTGVHESVRLRVISGAIRKQNPFPARTENQFLVRTFRRAALARTRFPDVSFSRGYDDRGEIFVFLGEPDHIITDHGGTTGSVGTALYPFEIWFYPSIDPDCYFTFVGKTGKSHFALVDGPESIFGTFYRGRRAFFERQQDGRTAAALRFDVYYRLAPVHPEFRRRIEELERIGNSSEQLDFALHRFPQLDRSHRSFLDTLLASMVFGSDNPGNNLSVKFGWLRFRAPDGNIKLETYLAVPFDELELARGPNKYWCTVRGQIALFDSSSTRVAADSVVQRIEFETLPAPNAGDVVTQFSFVVKPAQYEFLVRVDNTPGGRSTLLKTSDHLDPFPATALSLSDLQPALDVHSTVEESRFAKHGYFVKPVAGNVVKRRQPAFIYFEINNPRLSADETSTYSIRYEVRKERPEPGFFGSMVNLLGLGGGDEVVQDGGPIKKTGRGALEPMFLQFDFTSLDPGAYLLTVSVEDEVTGEESGRNIRLVLEP